MFRRVQVVEATETCQPYRGKEVRCHMTWQEFDRCLWLAGCADAADLAGEVLCPDEFVDRRKEVVLGFSKQVPFRDVITSRKSGTKSTTNFWFGLRYRL